MTGKPPFSEHRSDAIVMFAVIRGSRPQRPSHNATQRGLTDPVWALIEQCWSTDPGQRPSVLLCLNELECCAVDFSLHRVEELALSPSNASEEIESISDSENSVVSNPARVTVVDPSGVPKEYVPHILSFRFISRFLSKLTFYLEQKLRRS